MINFVRIAATNAPSHIDAGTARIQHPEKVSIAASKPNDKVSLGRKITDFLKHTPGPQEVAAQKRNQEFRQAVRSELLSDDQKIHAVVHGKIEETQASIPEVNEGVLGQYGVDMVQLALEGRHLPSNVVNLANKKMSEATKFNADGFINFIKGNRVEDAIGGYLRSRALITLGGFAGSTMAANGNDLVRLHRQILERKQEIAKALYLNKQK